MASIDIFFILKRVNKNVKYYSFKMHRYLLGS